MVTLSRKTQGGLGHRLRGRRGGKRAAPTPAERQWRRRPDRRKRGGARGVERRQASGETGASGSPHPRGSRAERGRGGGEPSGRQPRREREKERGESERQTRERETNGNSAAASRAGRAGGRGARCPPPLSREPASLWTRCRGTRGSRVSPSVPYSPLLSPPLRAPPASGRPAFA